MVSSLGHIEKTLADAYRKEIDQEENVWRSLPFFAATLALQLTVLSPLSGLKTFPSAESGAWWDAVGGFTIAGVATVTALVFLVASIWPARFRYIAPEPELLDYAEGLDADEQEAPENAPVDAEAALKRVLARQYAIATDHNRQINQRRALWRSFAGLATLMSVLATLWTVANVTLR